MKLGAYLTKQQITSLKFAKKLRTSVSSVNKWRIENRMPRPPMIIKIEKATRYSVKLRDWCR